MQQIFLSIVLIGGWAAGCFAQLTIVQDGQPRAVIVVEADQPKARHAAEAIQRYVERMSGATLPIVVEGAAADVKADVRLLVGHTREAAALGVDIPSGYDTTVRDDYGEEEGYVLKTVGRDVVIAGNNDGPYQGTIFAAYALLERLGCRFYFPGTWGEIVPETATLTAPALDVTSRPDFAVRDIWLSGWVPVTRQEREVFAEWCRKNGLGGADLYPVAGDGFLAYLLPPEEYAESNPEFYAMRKDGTRRVPAHPTTGAYQPRNTMLCLSNPKVLEESIANVRAALAGQRTLRNVTDLGVGISPPDGAPFCFCPDCTKANQNFNYPTYVHEPMTSEEYFGFAAAIARAIPDRFVATMAYSNREVPPQGVEPFPRNISVKHATISCDVLHPGDTHLWRRRKMMAMLRQWRALTPHVVVRDYNPGMLVGLYVPERDMANIAVNIPLYKQIGVKGMHREGRKVSMQTWLSYYLTAKLLWDADADAEALKREFYATFFGASSGPHVQAWWDQYESALAQTTVQVHEDWLLSHVVTPELVSKLRRHVNAAQAAPATEAQRERLRAFVLIAEHLAAFADMLSAERNLDYAAAAGHAGRMLEIKQELAAIDPFLYTFSERRESHPEFTAGRKANLEKLASMTGGQTGTLVAALPLRMKFTRDWFNEGVIGQWYLPEFDDASWDERDTYLLWEQQEPPESDAGHDYDGYGWYRAAVEVAADVAGKPLRLYIGGAINEAWVWVNGKYAGHKPFKLWWGRDHSIDLDVSGLVEPGRSNTIAIRVWNNADVGGMYRRGFLWSPREE